MPTPKNQQGKIKLGLAVFVVLLALVAGRFVYMYADRATSLTEEAKELMQKGKIDSAMELLDQALADNPDHLQANYHRGICLAERQRFDEAMAAFDKTAALEPKEANSYFNKGRILHHLQRYQEAVPVLERAIEYQGNLEKPNRANAWLLLGDSLYELYLDRFHQNPQEAGSPAQAVSAYKSYLQERPGASDRRAVEQKMDIIENPERYREELQHRQESKRTAREDLRKGPITLEELKQQVEEAEKQQPRKNR